MSFVFIIFLIAIFYLIAVKVIQNKFVDKEKLRRFRERSNELTKRMNEANKRKDKEEMDRILKEQTAMFPEMSKIMFEQLKMSFIVIAVFLIATNILGYLDPYKSDDMSVSLVEGTGCDGEIDGVFEYCFTPENNGTWVVEAIAYNEGKEVGRSYSLFYYGNYSDPGYAEPAKGSNPPNITFSKKGYTFGEEVRIYIESKGDRIDLNLDKGTHFMYELPFEIPIINVKRIYQPTWFFILITLVLNIVWAIILKVKGG